MPERPSGGQVPETHLHVRFWGVRGSIPCPGREYVRYGGNTTALQICRESDEKLLILDAGTGLRCLGDQLQESNSNAQAGRIFITHSHWDHIQGLPFFKPFYSEKSAFTIHMPEQYQGGTEEVLDAYLTKSFFPINLSALKAAKTFVTQPEERSGYEGYSIEYMVANHPNKTAIYKISMDGCQIIFAPDNELSDQRDPSMIRFMERFKEFIRGCDLLVHDAQYDRLSYPSRAGRGHSSWESVVEVARECGVRRLLLTHHDPDSTDGYLEEVDSKLERYRGEPFLRLELAREGMDVTLPKKGVSL
ncbi:MAG: MBL fold metallo-hydrolase [Balneolaceae bacterium]